jgi:hypothetical protein
MFLNREEEPERPSGPTAAELFEEAVEEERFGNEQAAVDQFQALLERFPDSPEAAEARRHIDSIRQRAETEQEADQAGAAWQEYTAWRDQHRDDLNARQERLSALRNRHPALAERIAAEEADIQETRRRREAGERQATLDDLQERVANLDDTGTYDAVIADLEDFRARFANTDAAARADALLTRAREAHEAAYATAETAANEALAAGDFDRAIGIYRDLAKHSDSDLHERKVRRQLAAILEKIAERKQETIATVRRAIRQLAFNAASRRLEEDTEAFAGLPDHEETEQLLSGVRTLAELHRTVIERIEESGARQTRLTFSEMPNQKNVSIVGASEESLLIAPTGGIEIGLKWAKLTPAELLTVYRLYGADRSEKGKQALEFYENLFPDETRP